MRIENLRACVVGVITGEVGAGGTVAIRAGLANSTAPDHHRHPGGETSMCQRLLTGCSVRPRREAKRCGAKGRAVTAIAEAC